MGSGSSGLRAALGVLCALPFLVAVPSVAGGSGAPDLGTPPPDCGAVHRDYADPSCTTQTRNGTFSLSAHVVHTGGTLTGTIGARCMHHNGIGFDQQPNELCTAVSRRSNINGQEGYAAALAPVLEGLIKSEK